LHGECNGGCDTKYGEGKEAYLSSHLNSKCWFSHGMAAVTSECVHFMVGHRLVGRHVLWFPCSRERMGSKIDIMGGGPESANWWLVACTPVKCAAIFGSGCFLWNVYLRKLLRISSTLEQKWISRHRCAQMWPEERLCHGKRKESMRLMLTKVHGSLKVIGLAGCKFLKWQFGFLLAG